MIKSRFSDIWYFLSNRIYLDDELAFAATENLSDDQLTRKYKNCVNSKKLWL